jgi:hypothetical protein
MAGSLRLAECVSPVVVVRVGLGEVLSVRIVETRLKNLGLLEKRRSDGHFWGVRTSVLV